MTMLIPSESASKLIAAIRFATLVCLLLASAVLQAQPYQQALETDPSIGFAGVNDNRHQMHYAYAGDIEKPGILFIHGTPGGWAAFEVYLNNRSLQKDFFMVSVDRLGWGKSTLAESTEQTSETQNPLSFATQAQALLSVLRQFPDKKWLLVGHSLGASIAPKVALTQTPGQQNPVVGLLLLAGTIAPDLGGPRWYNRVSHTKLASWLLPASLKYSNNEIMVLHRELSILEAQLSGQLLTVEVVVMQGMKDRLVSPKNPDYMQRVWPPHFSKLRFIELPNAGHFLPWRQTDLVITTIRQFQLQALPN